MTIRDSDMGNSGVARALWAGAAVAIAGAIGWGLLGAYAETQTWLIAVAVGIGVGWVMTRLVDKPSTSLMVAAVLFTLGAVVLGQILIIAFTINKNFGNFDFPLSFRLYREAISSGDITEDLLFGLGGGAVGAFYSVRMLRSKNAAPPATPPPPPAN